MEFRLTGRACRLWVFNSNWINSRRLKKHERARESKERGGGFWTLCVNKLILICSSARHLIDSPSFFFCRALSWHLSRHNSPSQACRWTKVPPHPHRARRKVSWAKSIARQQRRVTMRKTTRRWVRQIVAHDAYDAARMAADTMAIRTMDTLTGELGCN